ncbi:MAG: ferric reductase-like transmembrane domain-containing protein [Actinobacteria bacterium]|nr:ferric reductase-like transmembrane domain-containing protein [Actinomycetota bacterium]
MPLVGDPKSLWYVNRASGLVLLVFFTGVVMLGQVSTVRETVPAMPRFVSIELHRNLSVVSLILLLLHVVTAVRDTFVDIAVIDVMVPFHSPYRPLWLSLGTIALDLMVAIAITSAVRHRMEFRHWRAVHWLSYLAWVGAVLHGLGTGTDTRQRVTLVVTFVCITLVVIGALLRVTVIPKLAVHTRIALFAAVALVPVLLIMWLRAGPLAPDWAKRAGTPPPPSKIQAGMP